MQSLSFVWHDNSINLLIIQTKTGDRELHDSDQLEPANEDPSDVERGVLIFELGEKSD